MADAPIQIIDNDDGEFDWEEAVQQIEVACRNTLPSISCNPPPPPPALWRETKFSNKCHKTCRQSTLEKFVTCNGSSKSLSEMQIDKGRDEESRIEAKERVLYVGIDPEAAKTWIYPANVPCRDYQLTITKTALFSNTLVALPTGLGKTLIAAVVMYNYFRWFPEGKIVFAAPSRPLVMQQIEACHNIVGIPQEWTIDMTGQTSPTKRALLWKSKRVFFVTPQVLEKDIQSGICLVKYLVCLVIDEAHRAMGNYSYCMAVRKLMAVPVQLRILALTATPGSKHQTIQHVIDNLHISILEYRSESDHDVSPYVHDRKIELLEVPMGQNAIAVNNLLLDVIRPIAARLCTMGLLQNRDFQTLSPYDLLNSRDQFRQAPPQELSHLKYGEVEGYFGVLITLYHIRKLLSSHGIRPAYEMLEEKLKQGSFARLMSRNEVIQKAKLIMQENLSHGALSPKFSKMIEILVDHFRTNNPQNSRVIIFSNFRGSVRDIMEALSHVGDSIKAAQFVGQSSGKTTKGQTQKVQQAVLEKFRSGGYNVIVATSIGEEGLDIMEVDLVICFDANISPLRMIQRMGRTGRKHDGRVDILPSNIHWTLLVLACEGTELKGYMRKQATSKAVRKQMRNGGMNSFTFHSSPRMVPHIYKPELQCLELSIKQFVPRGRKVKDGCIDAPKVIEKLADAEAVLLAKYFEAEENAWKPSLIAFPRFQELPSTVHRVMHSSRTGFLIDVLQFLKVGSSEQHIKSRKESPDSINSADVEKKIPNTVSIPMSEEKCSMLDCPDEVLTSACIENKKSNLPLEALPLHSYLFGSEVASVDSHGRVLVAQVNFVAALGASNRDRCKSTDAGHRSEFCADARTAEMLETADNDENILQRPLSEEKHPCQRIDCGGSPNNLVHRSPMLHAECNDDIELSPRLTSFIRRGCVPESPLNNIGLSNGEGRDQMSVAEPTLLTKLCAERLTSTSGFDQKEANATNDPHLSDVGNSPVKAKALTPVHKAAKIAFKTGNIPNPFAGLEIQTTLGNLSNDSYGKDWHMGLAEKSETVEVTCKFKRLRKIGDSVKGKLSVAVPNLIKPRKGNREQFKDVRNLIEEEAEVSSEVEVSDDEVDEQDDDDSYEDSFIDDKVDPTAANSQAEDGKIDMMAIYRRSLLSQSPIIRRQDCSSFLSPESAASMIRTTGSGSCSRRAASSPHTPQDHSESAEISVERNSLSSRFSKGVTSTSGRILENTDTIESRKRKFSRGIRSVSAINLDNEFMLDSTAAGGVSPVLDQADLNGDLLSDDQFYEGLDFDELESQAAKLLNQKAEPFVQKERISDLAPEKNSVPSCPSFDLGIP
ncbi:hypothetical protein Nepgr_024249 [Nepenthes gracilis]|uniref:DEAD-box ATP-dependent RNA helicase FANCM n=1 Tax=Nepenthes gracilis TaxID=150966 RepID=A0AAD3T4B6_NEPGR|nr:hypothetical protein Nepgr_024249 [Nepenthes gracilis]